MDQSPQPSNRVVQALEVIEKGGDNAELRIKTDDEASSLLWAAQWLDEHREFSVVGIRLDTESSADVEDDCTATLIIELWRVNTRAPRRFGPWAQGVPTLHYAPHHNDDERPSPTTKKLDELTAALERVAMHLGDR